MLGVDYGGAGTGRPTRLDHPKPDDNVGVDRKILAGLGPELRGAAHGRLVVEGNLVLTGQCFRNHAEDLRR